MMWSARWYNHYYRVPNHHEPSLNGYCILWTALYKLSLSYLFFLSISSCVVWEVKFDSCHPNNLFTCSQDGALWHWDVNDTTPIAGEPPYQLSSSRYSNTLHTTYTSQMESFSIEDRWSGTAIGTSSVTSPWLSDAVQRGKVNIQDYSPGQGLSVNSLDVESQRLVCGTDGEALFVIPHLSLRWTLLPVVQPPCPLSVSSFLLPSKLSHQLFLCNVAISIKSCKQYFAGCGHYQIWE